MKSPGNKIIPFIVTSIGIIVLIGGIISRVSGDATGTDLIISGCLLLVMSIAIFSAQRTRLKA